MIGQVEIQGSDGQQFETHTARLFPLGTVLKLQDGRQFRYAENGAVALVAGRLVQSEVPGANWDELALPSAVAVGARTLSVTNGATTIAKDDFAGGYLVVEDDAGEGHIYLLEANDAEAAGSADFSLTLAPGNGIKVALTTATTVSLLKHPDKDVIIHPSPPTAAVRGVTAAAIAANSFGWLQFRGTAAVLTEGTLVIGNACYASGTTDGAVAPAPATTDVNLQVGVVVSVGATTEHSPINLNLP